ncbi:D-erythro-7,8-dihydroneopterin triphosphate epimerase [Colwellia sp. MT41]|uniref:dihydroneopterin aldolase n=1 Tax=unclassified Colwellia TaxID=196834 RepID=UPI000709C053|nr:MULTISPECIES: dihydroneopterin aldolase [unclassified Colwellia]ALO34804.1 D-erythro-7,8-dihydroneopterin triphosphate epimerase [Colwellia sp. MT41]
MSTIYVEKLEIYAILGITDEERENKQKLIIDYWIDTDISKAMMSDDIADCVNYRTVNKEILSVVLNSSYNTIERLLGILLELILSFDGALHAKIKIAKPGALRYAKSVSVTAERFA